MVDITVALPEGTAVTRDDAIRTLNAELLSGNGPDVLVLDGLPVENYIEQGMLLDLSSVVQPMLDSGALLPNVASSFAEAGSIPAVPTRFLLPTLWGEVSGVETLADMAAWAQANPDALPLYATDPAFCSARSTQAARRRGLTAGQARRGGGRGIPFRAQGDPGRLEL